MSDFYFSNYQLQDNVHYFLYIGELKDLIKTTDKLWAKWTDGIFVSLEYSAAGANSIIAHRSRDIVEKFHEENDMYLISRNIPYIYDPTVLAVVANIIAEQGIPVLDGLGPSGANDHSKDEYMIKESLFQRASLLACSIHYPALPASCKRHQPADYSEGWCGFGGYMSK